MLTSFACIRSFACRVRMVILQPGSSVKFTNVAYIRMRRLDKRFEIVCYRNKVQDWRSKIEKDLDEVVQVPQVFVNVSKGEVASVQDLQKYFNTDNVNEAVLEILNKGELQVGGKERLQQQQQIHQSVLELVAGRVINPKNQRPYPASIIEKALNLLDFRFSSTKAPKGQALEAIKLLVESQIIPIARAAIRVRVSDENGNSSDYINDLKAKMESVLLENFMGDSFEIVGLINPSNFRELDDLVMKRGTGVLEVMASETEHEHT